VAQQAIEEGVARSMLSFSNFGSVDDPYARKVRRATELASSTEPRWRRSSTS